MYRILQKIIIAHIHGGDLLLLRKLKQRIHQAAFHLVLQHRVDLVVDILQEPVFGPCWSPPDSVRILADDVIAKGWGLD